MSNDNINTCNEKNTFLYMRTKDERKAEVYKVINKLTNLKITTEFEAIRKLFKIMSVYVSDGIRQDINIDFPEFSRKIKGVLATNSKEKVWVMLEKQKH